jgi:hypothetical protein
MDRVDDRIREATVAAGCPRGMSRSRGIIARFGLGLMGLVLGLLLVEGALRLVQPIPSEQLLPLTFHERRLRRLVKGEAYVTYDQTLGWVTTPGIRQRIGNHLYRHNDDGLRAEREYALAPPSGVRRIAAFGDSFTYCHEVNFQYCWTEQVGEAWPVTEVLNFGVPGYGPDQAWLRYQREGQTYAPCAVTIGYMVENINRVVNRYRPSLVPITDLLATKPRFILDGDALALLPNPASSPDLLADRHWVEQAASAHDRWYFPNAFVESPLDVFELGRVVRTATYRYQHGDPDVDRMRQAYHHEDEAFQIVGRVLIGFARQVERDGSTPVVVFFSQASEISSALDGHRPVHEPLLQWLARENVPTIDVTPDLVAEAGRSELSAIVEHHYTPLGNRVVAQALARQLPDQISGTCGGEKSSIQSPTPSHHGSPYVPVRSDVSPVDERRVSGRMVIDQPGDSAE